MNKKKNPFFEKNPSVGITVCHHSASLVMPNADPLDRFFYPTLTLMMDSLSQTGSTLARTISSGLARTMLDSYILVSVIVFCLAAVLFPVGFDMDQIGGTKYQLPNNFQVGISYIFFILALWLTVVSELFASKICLPRFYQ